MNQPFVASPVLAAQLIVALLEIVHDLKGCFLDFYTSFLANQPIPPIIVLARKRRYKNGDMSENLVDKKLCFNVRSSAGHLFVLDGAVPQFDWHMRDNGNNYLTSKLLLLPKHNNQPVWCFETLNNTNKQDDTSWQGQQWRRFRLCVMEYLWCMILHCSLSIFNNYLYLVVLRWRTKSMKVSTWEYTSDESPKLSNCRDLRFSTFSLLANLVSIPDLKLFMWRKLKSGMLPRFAERWRSWK